MSDKRYQSLKSPGSGDGGPLTASRIGGWSLKTSNGRYVAGRLGIKRDSRWVMQRMPAGSPNFMSLIRLHAGNSTVSESSAISAQFPRTEKRATSNTLRVAKRITRQNRLSVSIHPGSHCGYYPLVEPHSKTTAGILPLRFARPRHGIHRNAISCACDQRD